MRFLLIEDQKDVRNLMQAFLAGLGTCEMAEDGIRGLSLYVFSDREIRRVVAQAGFVVEDLLYLNHRRNGVLNGLFRGLRANGFLVCCQPADGDA